jgi:hypothetical protein
MEWKKQMQQRRLTLITSLALLLFAACGGNSTTTPSLTTTAPSSTISSLTIQGSPVAEVSATGYQFIALAQYSNLTVADVTTSATWTSSNTQIAAFTTIAGRPLLSTFQSGTVTITASYSGKTATLNVTVGGGSTPSPGPDSIRLTSMAPPSGAALSRGQTVTFSGTLSYSVASADSGTVTLVIQDQANQVLQPAGSQPRTTVARGNGQATLSQSITLPTTGTTNVTAFFSLAPVGSTNTHTVASASYSVQ